MEYDDPMDLRSGSRLGIYEVLAPLAAGGMGEVYRARDSRLSRDVAIKVLSEAFAGNPERLARFRREAQTLAALNHPNIGAIYGLEEEAGSPYIVLEFVDGETLAARLSRGAIPLREALSLGVQVATAVEAAHDRGIVHRDLKPGNIMITATGVVKVLDFGLAKSDAILAAVAGREGSSAATALDATTPGMVIGTAAYMSPEQARGASVDRRSDVWAFGCVLYEMVTARTAFAGETPSDVIARILEREPDWALLPAGVPGRIRDLLHACLRKDPEARPRDIRDVRLALADGSVPDAAAAAGRETSIAVLPFENLSGPDDEYFADGVTDEILNALAQVDGLRVAARTSCFAFKGKREGLGAVREKLGVNTVLEGSVRRAGNRLRITVQLVKAADGYQLWAERYDREMTDVFEVQEEIAKAIATRLRGSLQDEAYRGRVRRGTKNLEAYELLLKGRALQTKRGRFLPEAIACFERAIELDPQYADALAWLADSYRLIGTFGGAPFSEVMPKARELADRALSIDPELAEALATKAAVTETYDRRFVEGEALYEQAIRADPRHARARCQRALWGYIRGTRTADWAVAETTHAVADDPLNSWIRAMHSWMLSLTGRHDESLVEAEAARQLDLDSFFAHWNLMRCHANRGDYERAIALAPAVLSNSGRHPWALGVLGWVCCKVGRREAARAVHDELEARSRLEFASPYWLASTAASAGCATEAIAFARRAAVEHDPLVLWGRVVPFWDGVRALPGYEDAVRGVWG